jgi:predicted transcriptional regulator
MRRNSPWVFLGVFLLSRIAVGRMRLGCSSPCSSSHSAAYLRRREVISLAQSSLQWPSKCGLTKEEEKHFCKPASHCAKVCVKAVDSHWSWPYAGLMELHVPPDLEAKLTRMAAATGRTADQVALDLLTNSIDHDEWFRAEVEKGRASAREGRLVAHDDVEL